MSRFIYIEGEALIRTCAECTLQCCKYVSADCFQEIPWFEPVENIAASVYLLETTDIHVFFNGPALFNVELANGRRANPNP